mmetsp:Transcript_97671/g.157522  ORF Transcript_97671/g.157522 Transcript_97671/m.157522 type:complete len:432 (+) Transcript_97671:33-1328(+)|eukprot:CAMPEP_0179428270 /NCGR_PEP_ID=MMETSP0799-20121207/13983_1 /TAXON_ID=46947 /ORGANISM="Geminigera cryophila, Strain CCMP2564" /LENGTH=431 /DNA_ID=CAMNT_0021203679 /DNA_START=542 /DNA_END=1837 /DNA_ORIENTATION=+
MPTAPTVRVQAPLPNTGIVFERHKKGSWFQATFKAVFFGLVPLFVVYFAAFIAYVSTTPIPAGTFFWVVFQPSLWMATKTVEVPANFTILPRPAHEKFLELPGGSKMPMSGLGMCCRGTAYHDESVRRSVLWYLLQGGRHIDTAALYLNHEAIGLGLKDAMARGIPRAEIFVTTKIFTTHYNETLASEWVRSMLKELDLEYVDLVLMHAPRRNFGVWPGFIPRFKKFMPVWEEEVRGFVWHGGLFASIWPNDVDEDFLEYGCKTGKECREQTWAALSKAREQGLIKELGVSNFRIYHLKELQKMDLAPVAVNQLQFHPWIPGWQQDIVDYCIEHKIALTGYHSLGGTLNKGKSLSSDTLTDIASKVKRSPASILQRWAIQKNVSVIPGSGNPHHMKENLEVFSFELSDADMARIDELKKDPIIAIPEFINK